MIEEENQTCRQFEGGVTCMSKCEVYNSCRYSSMIFKGNHLTHVLWIRT